jgi:hypothetical protein
MTKTSSGGCLADRVHGTSFVYEISRFRVSKSRVFGEAIVAVSYKKTFALVCTWMTSMHMDDKYAHGKIGFAFGFTVCTTTQLTSLHHARLYARQSGRKKGGVLNRKSQP